MLIFVQLSTNDASKEQAVRNAFRKAYGTDPVISTGGNASVVLRVVGTPNQNTESHRTPETEWVRNSVATTVEGAQRTLQFCLASAA